MGETSACPVCGARVKTANLPRHLESVHPNEAGGDQVEAAKAEAAKARRTQRRPAVAPRIPWKVVAAVVAVVFIAGGALLVGGNLPAPAFNPNACTQDTGVADHFHPLLKITIDGVPMEIPGDVGVRPGCTGIIHTHHGEELVQGYRQLHFEGPSGHAWRLGEFFEVWDVPFSENQIGSNFAGGSATLTMLVNDTPNTDFGDYVLPKVDGTRIDIVYQSG